MSCCGEANLLSLGSVHVDVKLRLIEWLLDAQVSSARNAANLLQTPCRPHARSPSRSLPDHLNVDRRGQVRSSESGVTMSAGRKANITPGNFFAKRQPQFLYVRLGRMVLWRQGHHDVRIRPYRSAPNCCRRD